MNGRLGTTIACGLILIGLAAPALAQSSQNSPGKDERARALIGLARVKRDAGDAAGARQYFEQAGAIRTLEPQEREEYFWVLARVDGKNAVATGRAILADTPNRGSVRDWLIGQLLTDHDEAAIVSLAQEGERIEPGVALWPRRIGQSAIRTGNADVAAAAFERALKKTGTSSEDERGRQQALDLRQQSAPQTPQTQAKQELDLARKSGDVRRAVTVAQSIAASADATPADRLTVVELLIQAGDSRAAKSLEAWVGQNGCSAQTLTLADRLRDPDGTAVLVKLLNTPACPIDARWLERGIERTEALGQHAAARPLLARLPAASANKPAMRRLSGQVALWTGHPAEAIPTLEAVIRDTPGDTAARTSLVDAYRAVGRAQDAWAAAEPLAQRAGGADNVLMYADLALQAGKLDAAYRLLSSLDPAVLNPSSALALIDCAVATSGPDRAVVVARTISAGTPAFRDVVARQYVLEALVGDVTRAAAKRATLASWDARVTADADGEILGRVEQAHVAAPSAESRARIEGIAGFLPGNAEAALMLARTRASAGDARGAIAAVGETPVPQKDLSWLAELHAAVSRDELAQGHPEAARVSAQRAVAIDPSRKDVWNSLAELAAAEGPQALASLTERGAPPEAIAAFHFFCARAFAAKQQWDTALTSVDAALAMDNTNVAATRLKADVLAWSGRHADGIAAYDAYLSRHPEDLDAARQRARVLGWAGRFDEAKRSYARLATSHPDVAVVAAEAAAKTAFFDGRWNDAADAYARWLTIEPANGEAAFERAQSLRAAGRVAEADAALQQLAQSGGHQLAAPAWDVVQERRKPAVTAITDSRSSDGYQGRRLLDLQSAGAAFRATTGRSAATFNADASYVRLTGGDSTSRGYRFGAASTWTPSASVSIRGQATGWSLDSRTGVIPEYLARVDWRPIDRWTIGTGTDRSLLLENLDVVNRGLSATGAFGSARFDSPVSSLDANVGWHHLSDGNERTRATVSYGRRLSERMPDLRLLVWSEALMFREVSDAYYSPARQLRVDAGLQYTHNFKTLRFAQDFRKSLTMGYLVGTDRDGVIYHHPLVNLTFEFANGLGLVARGDWIRSDVYNDQSVSVHFTVTPFGNQK